MATRSNGRFEKSARMTPANAITMARLLASPVMVVLIVVSGASWFNFALWILLASTDFVDGWVARRQGSTSSGAFLDPLADKFLVLGALVALVAAGSVWWLPVLLIGARELGISAYRSAIAKHGVSMPARPLAKAKTASQDLAISLLLIPPVAHHASWTGRAVLWVAVVLALASAAQYLLDARRGAAATGNLSAAQVDARKVG